MTDDRKCDSPKRGVKGIREVSQLTERCDGCQLMETCGGHGGGVRGWRGVMVLRQVFGGMGR